jgi:hypothetical protein
MRRGLQARIERLEGQAAKVPARDHDMNEYRRKTALMAIVAAHVGKWGERDSLAEAYARALGISSAELKRALDPDVHDDAGIWDKTITLLEDLVAQRGGRRQDIPTEEDSWSDRFEVLRELYDEVPQRLKDQMKLFEHLPSGTRVFK